MSTYQNLRNLCQHLAQRLQRSAEGRSLSAADDLALAFTAHEFLDRLPSEMECSIQESGSYE